MGVIAEGIPRGCQGLFTIVPLGYPLSVFNKNSTLKERQILDNNFQFLNPLPTYKHIHFKTTFTCPRSIMIVGVSWSQALLGYLITAHHLCAFLMYLAC